MQDVALSRAAHGRAILKLGLPLIASNVAQFAIHITDTIMLGWYDVTALAAATIATTLFFLTFIVGAGFAFAVTPLVAAAAEAEDSVQVRRVTRMGGWLSIFYGGVVMVPFFWSEDILLWIGQAPDVAALGHDYLIIALWGMVPALLVMTLKSYLAALEHTAIILWGTIIAAVLNVALNYVLIFGNFGAPELGIRGAAIASVALQAATVGILLLYGLRVLPQYKLLQNIFKPDNEIMGQVFRLGWPIGVTSLAEGGLFSVSAIMIGWIGELELAAHGIVIQLASLAFVVHVGLSQVATIRAGRALGRRDEASLRRGGHVAFFMSFAFAMVTVCFFLLFSRPVISAFLGADEPARDQVIAIGIGLLAMAALFQVVDALQVMALGMLRGVQDTTVPMFMAAISYWGIGIPVSYLLTFEMGLGPVGIWLGLVIGLTIACMLLNWRFWTRSVRINDRFAAEGVAAS
ncbi:multidrug resistance protein, MATE family [Cognatiyoonia koreensis]|uniref:Multidrug-efflux transporter n=1 Tax=Cognatiyoonia koreensis TaxID=364200 RepID=A0A1I0QA01_9RHOB|nr:MATE family efflux transporter [Cognatiyoonia koreensis]SEW23386.1 multidrug resistance protein, MATE family [Cognatiyoonia koreensis]